MEGEPFYEIPIKNKEETYKTIIELIRSDILRTGNEFNFDYFCEYYKLIAIDLSKQKSDLKNQQINFIGSLGIINLLDHKDEDNPRFETRKWYIVNDHNNGNYSQGDDVQSIAKFDTEIVRLFYVIILMLIF